MSTILDKSAGNHNQAASTSTNNSNSNSNSKGEVTFGELETYIQKDLPNTTVDKLKSIIEHLNTYPNLHLAKTGRKQELIERVQEAFRSFRRNSDLPSFRRAKSRADEIMYPNYGSPYSNPHSNYRSGYVLPGSGAGAGGGSSEPTTPTTPTYNYGAVAGTNRVWNANAMSAGVNRGAASPFMGNSARNGSPAASSSYSTWGQRAGSSSGAGGGPGSLAGGGGRGPMLINWKQTPAWTAIRAITDLQILPPIEEGQGHSAHKKEKTFSFTIPPDVVTQLGYVVPSMQGNQPPVKKDLRIFCTTSEYYPNNHSSRIPTPIEWPHAAEMFINHKAVAPFKKGTKGKADTAPPLHIGAEQGMRLDGTSIICTMTHTGPSVNKKTKLAKKFLFQIVLAEITSTEELKRRVLTKRKSKDTIVNQMKAKADEDEIQVGSSKLQLKCPLSYMRIQYPIRAETCSHAQCCDLGSWLSINEGTPTWSCPSCDTEMKFDQIYVDEFFLAIVQACPESVDEVILEADGEWHTEDGKYASAAWKAQNPAPPPSARSTTASRLQSRIATPDIKPFGASSPVAIGSDAAEPSRVTPQRSFEVIELDDSDDEDTLPNQSHTAVARSDTGNTSVAGPSRLANSVTPAVSSRTGGNGVDDAIEICDSDEEEEPQPRRASLTPFPADLPLPPSPPLRNGSLDHGISPERRRSSLADIRKKRSRDYSEDSLSPLSDDSEYAPPPTKKKRLSLEDERDDMLVEDDLAAVWGELPTQSSRSNGDRGNTSIGAADNYLSKPPGIGRPRVILNVNGRSSSNRNPRTPSPQGRNGDSGRNGNAQAGSSRNGSGSGPATWNSFSKP